MLKSGTWHQAALGMLELSTVMPKVGEELMYQTMPLDARLHLLEYATVLVMCLKFRSCYLPDYCLGHLDSGNEAIAKLYAEGERIDLVRRTSSFVRQNSLSRQGSLARGDTATGKLKTMSILGKGKKNESLGDVGAYLRDDGDLVSDVAQQQAALEQ